MGKVSGTKTKKGQILPKKKREKNYLLGLLQISIVQMINRQKMIHNVSRNVKQHFFFVLIFMAISFHLH